MSTFSLKTEGIRPTPGLLLTSQAVLPVVLLGFTRWTCFAHCPSLSTIRIVQENALLKLIDELCSHPPLQWIRGPGMLTVFADLWSLCAEKDVWNDRMVLGVGRRFTHVHTNEARKLFHLHTVMTHADLVAGVIPKLWAAGDPQQLYWTPVSARFLWCASVLWQATFIPVHPVHKFTWFFRNFSVSANIIEWWMCECKPNLFESFLSWSRIWQEGPQRKLRSLSQDLLTVLRNGMMRIIASSTAFFRIRDGVIDMDPVELMDSKIMNHFAESQSGSCI